MRTLTVSRENNFFTRFRAFKVFVDEEFIDYIEPDQKVKEVSIPLDATKLNIKLDWCSSNTINLKDIDIHKNISLRVTSQIQNGLFIFITVTFFGGGILNLLGYINLYMGFATTLPMAIIVFWQTYGRKRLLRISKL